MYSYDYPHPAVTVDAVVFARCERGVKVLLIERRHEPCKGMWAFPGGFINIDETAESAVRRELEEETGLRLHGLRQIGAFTAVDRDPRERVITIAFYTIIDHIPTVYAADDAAKAQWFDIDRLPPLAFDHADILRRARQVAKFLLMNENL